MLQDKSSVFAILLWPEARVHLSGQDFVFAGIGEAEFADCKSGVRVGMIVANRWSERTAENRPVVIKIAGLGTRIEQGTGIRVCPLLQTFDCVRIV